MKSKIKRMRNEQYTNKFYYSGDILLSVYKGKPEKKVLLLTTLNTNAAIAENKKKTPETVKHNNEVKYGANVVERMAWYYE